MSEVADQSWRYRCVMRLLSGLLSSIWGLEIGGLDHLPSSGRVIVAVNHVSWMDPPVAALAVFKRGRYPRFLAKRELFRYPVLGWILRFGGVIPLDRSRGDVGAIRSAIGVLEAEGCMILFPEGTRSRTGMPGHPKPGVGFLAHQTRAPVVPARVWNTRRFPALVPMKIKFGPAMRFDGRDERESFQQFAQQVMDAVHNL